MGLISYGGTSTLAWLGDADPSAPLDLMAGEARGGGGGRGVTVLGADVLAGLALAHDVGHLGGDRHRDGGGGV
jgi:hypothetical protein